MRPLRPGTLERWLPRRRRLGRPIRLVQRCASTQQEVRGLLDAGIGPMDGLLLATEEQLAGRGRRNRDWWSGPPGANIAVTLVLDPPPRPPEAAGVLAACALAAALRPWTSAAVALKWPNDLLLDGAKVAGLLAERVQLREGASPLLLGLGVNVHAEPPAGKAAAGACCLAARARREPAREALLASWLWGLERRLLRLERAGPADAEAEFLALLRAWAPHGVEGQVRDGGVVAGPLLEFRLSRGLTWGPEGGEVTQPSGWITGLRPLAPAS